MNIYEPHASAPGRLFCALVVALLTMRTLGAQSFSLDDNPFAPIGGAPAFAPPGIGFGAENPFGIPVAGYPPGLAPSPTLFPGILAAPNLGDGAILSPSPLPGALPPIVQHPGPDGFYVASTSSNKAGLMAPLSILFSVDRMSVGLPGTAVAAEAAVTQAMGDIYSSTVSFAPPGAFAGTLVGGGFALPTFAGFLLAGPPVGGNALVINQGLPAPGIPGLGLMNGLGMVLPPGAPAPPLFPDLHDNVDGFDTAMFEVTGDPIFDANHYFSVYPAEAAALGFISSADLFLAAAGTPGAVPVPFAPSFTLGLDTLGSHPIVGTPFSDSVDALVMWDNGIPGVLEPGLDYALFSLGTGSASLGALAGLVNDSDVLFTDFTGVFAVYASAASLGLIGDPAGGFLPRPFVGLAGPFDGLDALDVVPIPEPASFVLAAWTLVVVWGFARGRRVG